MGKIMIPAFLAVLFVLSGCMQDIQSLEKGNPAAARKVLVAGAGSDFKNQVVMKVVQALSAEDCYIKIVSPDNLSEEKTGGYNAILLVTAMMAGRLNGQIVKFIAGDPANPKVIVFCTSGDENLQTDRIRAVIGKADAVTSASVVARVDERARQILDLVRKRF